MPVYRFLALDANGHEEPGIIEALDYRSAAEALRARQLRAISIEDASEFSLAGAGTIANSRIGLPVRSQSLIFFFQQLAVMTRSGLTLLQSLEMARGLSRPARFADSIDSMAEAIKGGSRFSDAMAATKHFPPLAVQLVKSAESSGELDSALERIGVHLQRKADTFRDLITAMAYPSIVVLATIGVSWFLMVTIMPKFATYIMRKGAVLPPTTQLLIDISNAVMAATPYLIGGFIVAAIGLMYAYSTSMGRLAIDSTILKVPVVGKLVTTAAMSQATWTLAILLQSGVTLRESLRVTQNIVGNRALHDAFARAGEQVLRGRELGTSLGDPAIPELVARLASVGERSGSLEQVMRELGAHYDKQLQAAIKRLGALIEPVLIGTIGAMVGFVYYAFFEAVMATT